MKQNLQIKPAMKKKIELIDTKSSKITIAAKRKAPLKSELTIQFKELKEKYDLLEKRNIQNIVTIERLELKVKELEKNDQLKGKVSQKFCFLQKRLKLTVNFI